MSLSQLRASKKSKTLAEPTLDRTITNVLVAYPSFNNLAKDILSVVGQSDSMCIGGVSWKKFEDGFPNLMILNVENFRSRNVTFLADFLHLETIFAQLSGTPSFLKILLTIPANKLHMEVSYAFHCLNTLLCHHSDPRIVFSRACSAVYPPPLLREELDHCIALLPHGYHGARRYRRSNSDC